MLLTQSCSSFRRNLYKAKHSFRIHELIPCCVIAAVVPTSPSRRATVVRESESEVSTLRKPSIGSSQDRARLNDDNIIVKGFVAREMAEVQNVKHVAEKAREDKETVAAKEAEDRQKATEAREAHRLAVANLEKNTANIRRQREAVHRQAAIEAQRAKAARIAAEAEEKRQNQEAYEAKKVKEERTRKEAETRKLDALFNEDGDLFDDIS